MAKQSPKHRHSQDSERHVVRWKCPNCGQTLFTAGEYEPPDLCAYCQDMTTWQRVESKDEDA